MPEKDTPDSRHTQYVYLVPQGQQAGQDANSPDDEIDLRALWQTIWSGRWIIVAVTMLFMTAGVVYALTVTEWYQAEVVLLSVGKNSISGGLGQPGGLTSLAGIDIPSAGSGQPLAVLKSKSFAREFIEDQKLLPVLFADEWDSAKQDWKAQGKARPDIRDGVKYFDAIVRTVTEDKKSGLVTLSIKWKSGVLAADWANLLARRLNDRLRAEAIHEAQSSIEYLQKEMLASSVLSLQQSIGRVLEGEMQKMALARAKEQFGFKVIDAASVPKRRLSPKRAMIVLVAGLAGAILSALALITLGAVKRARTIR
ncbi:MAG: Wzz/FepE/Etk N-terminal domain-containing protein [Proteobacteria bacterium]|nr:Wzz/FepE/Etk N-terminal domain-containing protein [Pseudomonadota bacterium]